MSDILIIGGGLIGMLTAMELHRGGAKVCILERSRMGGESSWAGGGILSPLYPWRYDHGVNELANYGHHHYPRIAQQLHEETGLDPEYVQSGLLVLDLDEQAKAEDWAGQWQMELQSVSPLDKLEPNINPAYQGGLYLPGIGQMRNPRLVKALKQQLDVYGIEYHENTEVDRLLIEDGLIRGVSSGNQQFRGDKVIVSGGAWSRRIIQDYGSYPQVEPVKGQMIVYKAEAGLLQHILLGGGRYLIPRRDGRIVVGSTLEYAGFDKTTDQNACQDLHQAAMDMLPALENCEIEKQWAGLRPGSPRGIPYICAHPDIGRLYINAGHFRNGVIIGAASALLMADLVLGREPEISPQAYRFEASH